MQPDNWRPRLIYLSNADNVIISNTTFINSPYHNLELYTNNTELTDLTILAPYDSPNTDGVDVHGMYVGMSAIPRHLTPPPPGSPFYIHDCYISVGDDNIAQHVNDTVIENNFFGTGHGASIGSVGIGYIQNVTFRSVDR